MTERLRALKGIVYPDPESIPIVRSAGGLSKLTGEQRAKVRLRKVKAGDWCDDLPPESVDHLIEKGGVVRVEVEGEPAKTLNRKTKFKAHRGEKVDIMPPVNKEE